MAWRRSRRRRPRRSRRSRRSSFRLFLGLLLLAGAVLAVWQLRESGALTVPQPGASATTPGATRGPARAGKVTEGTVTRIADGDTVEVTDDRGAKAKVRILGIDTPETSDPDTPPQCWGPEAKQFAQQAMGSKRVRLETDPSQDSIDRYNRTLAYVILPDGTNYSIAAARAGAARSYIFNNKPVNLYQDIAAAEQAAQQARVGLWGPPCNGSKTLPA